MASRQHDNRLDDSPSRQDGNSQGQRRSSSHSMSLRPRHGQPFSRTTAATSMPPPSSSPERLEDAQYQSSHVTPETSPEGRLTFDDYGIPINERRNEFLSHPSPSPQSMSRVWNSPSPFTQGQYFSIWEEPEGEPDPVVSNPEPPSDMDEDKENIFFYSPLDEEDTQPETAHNYSDRIDSQISSFDAFGMPLHVQFGPSIPVHPRESQRFSPDPLFISPFRQPANPIFRPATPSVIREDGTGIRDDLWTRNIFQARPERAVSQSNLFYHQLRRLRGRLFATRQAENARDQNNTRTETQDTTEVNHQGDRAADSEDEI